MNTIAKFTSAVLCGLALTACGGDNRIVDKTLTFSYDTKPLPLGSAGSEELKILLNQKGAEGYFYLYGDTFVNDGSGKTYTYELLDKSGNATDFVAQANAQGQKSYRYEEHWNIPWNVYRQDIGTSAKYTYKTENLPADATSFVVQANSQKGYLFVPTRYSTLQLPQKAIYMRDSTSRALYDYEVLDITLDKLRAEGAQGKGYRALFTREMGYPWLASSAVYVSDLQQPMATFTYESVAPEDVSINQMNNYGTQSYAYWGSVSSPSNIAFYVKASNCSGWICTALPPAGS